MFKVLAVKHMLYVQDMRRAVAFYRETFGATATEENPYWSELELSGSVIALHQGSPENSRHPTGLIVKVDNLPDACERIRGQGATVDQVLDQAFEGILLGICRDPEGNEFSVVQDR